ncbi:ty3-gypsy retrotransposon protein [Cucumis melo var. makuwa]|uniref:Ty3-gypsy retrotransposon protein n=1 Tax=Cucumis melo var. makuwa TaxID=1194695 RepID=A0A5D3DH55_CUCMM|nr:ty3-gypsy retrotransposon protein [Cucumis melo var. makuwa]
MISEGNTSKALSDISKRPNTHSRSREIQSSEDMPPFKFQRIFGNKSPSHQKGPAAWKAHLFLLLGLSNQISRVVPAWVSFEITTYLGLCGPTGRQSSMDIDMTRVTRWDPCIPIVLGASPGHRRPDFRSYGSACCTCSRTCQRLGTIYRTLLGSKQAPSGTSSGSLTEYFILTLFMSCFSGRGRGKGKGKLASDQK